MLMAITDASKSIRSNCGSIKATKSVSEVLSCGFEDELFTSRVYQRVQKFSPVRSSNGKSKTDVTHESFKTIDEEQSHLSILQSLYPASCRALLSAQDDFQPLGVPNFPSNTQHKGPTSQFPGSDGVSKPQEVPKDASSRAWHQSLTNDMSLNSDQIKVCSLLAQQSGTSNF